jgi:hypothetical protein
MAGSMCSNTANFGGVTEIVLWFHLRNAQATWTRLGGCRFGAGTNQRTNISVAESKLSLLRNRNLPSSGVRCQTHLNDACLRSNGGDPVSSFRN